MEAYTSQVDILDRKIDCLSIYINFNSTNIIKINIGIDAIDPHFILGLKPSGKKQVVIPTLGELQWKYPL